jgi:drug/metabolite transporter (DMT)-like permease
MKNNSHSSSSSYSFHKDTHNTKRKFTSYSVFYNGDHKNNFYNTTLVAEDKKHDNDIHGEQQQQEEEKTKGRFSVDYHDVATTNTTTHQSSQQPRKRMVASSAVPSSSVDSSSESKNASINMMDHNIKGAGAGPGKATARATNKKSRSWSLNIRALILPSAIGIWYILGVLSISTTKILLTNYESMGMTPSILTLQQLFIGMIILRLWMLMLMTRNDKSNCPIHLNLKKIISISYNQKESDTLGYFEVLSSGIFFTLGFLFTNLSFSAADASFVETIKASEPISSAGLSVLWKLETMSQKESYSLLGICVGVVISTVGNAHGANDNDHPIGAIRPSMMQSFRSSAIVMGSNLCFSFRSLYQKLFRASPMGRPSVVNDVSLQYLIHQIGVMVMTVLVILLDASSLLAKLYESISTGGILFSDQMGRFMLLSVVNGLAFTHYK